MLNQIKLSCTYRCIYEITLYKRIGLYNEKVLVHGFEPWTFGS